MTSKLSVGIVTFNRKDAVLKAIESVVTQGIKDIEIIVVDNNSTDGTGQAIREKYPSVKYIRLLENTGCPTGRNYTFANCTGDYIVNLDDDGFLEQGTLTKIKEAFDDDPQIGVVALKLKYTDEPRLSRAIGGLGEDVYHFFGGVSAFRIKMLEEVGYYPNDFFQYDEEADLALRALDAGWRIVSRPDIVMWHPRAGGGGGAKGTDWDYYRYRNALYVVSRNYPGILFLKYFFGRMFLHLASSLKRGTFKEYLKAASVAVLHLPRDLKRKRIKAETMKRYLYMRSQTRKKGIMQF
jgi:GT2 family glycosyltransferase